jgi:hypothetical protein
LPLHETLASMCYRHEWQYFHYDPEKPTSFFKLTHHSRRPFRQILRLR